MEAKLPIINAAPNQEYVHLFKDYKKRKTC